MTLWQRCKSDLCSMSKVVYILLDERGILLMPTSASINTSVSEFEGKPITNTNFTYVRVGRAMLTSSESRRRVLVYPKKAEIA